MPQPAACARRVSLVRTSTALLVTTALLAGAAPALGATGGGASSLPSPVLGAVQCRSDCAGVSSVAAGSILGVTGRNLRAVEEVVFLGGPGGADDASATPIATRRTRLNVRVPRGAQTGPVMLVNGDGAESRPSRTALTVLAHAPQPSSGGPAIDAEVVGRKVFFGGEQQARLTFLIRSDAPVDVGVDLVRAQDGAKVAHWDLPNVAPGTVQAVAWDGTSGGRVQREGRYRFLVAARAAGAAVASSSNADDPAAADPGTFMFLRHKFPIRGAHDYGGGAAGFGSSRDGHTHQGHDVFARCGTPLVAARGGVVRWKARQSRAGNYLVIDGDQTDVDYAYMHLQRPALVNKGDRVYTGQVVGYVGDTGRATGCHLHFEMWQGGWYRGGSPLDPLPQLRAWDRLS
jgi:murein DD-endopeptidase MepM/ murein hydrolase activator NlpD